MLQHLPRLAAAMPTAAIATSVARQASSAGSGLTSRPRTASAATATREALRLKDERARVQGMVAAEARRAGAPVAAGQLLRQAVAIEEGVRELAPGERWQWAAMQVRAHVR